MRDDDGDIGHRHLLGTAGLQKPGVRQAWCVRIVVAVPWAHARSGQLLVSALTNLLCRQIGIVRRIAIVASPAAARIVMPDGQHYAQLSEGLAALPAWAVNNQVTVGFGEPAEPPDFTIFVGAPSVLTSAPAIVILGDGWCAWVGAPGSAPDVAPVSDNPLGPVLAAALAAGEVFKRHCGLAARGKYLDAAAYSLWSGETAARWDAVTQGPPAMGCAIEPLHLIGAGAVGNDVAYVLGYLQASAYPVLIDNQTYSKTNLNRCLVSGWNDQGHDKVASVARFLAACGIGSFAFPGTVKDYVTAPRSGLRGDVAWAVDDLDFGLVLSCVDNSLARHDIQGLSPKRLLGASSWGLQAKTQFYSGCSGAPCLACFHPVEPNTERLAALKVTLRSMSVSDRRAFLMANKLDAAAVEKYLQDPGCGGLGEAILRAFATAPPDEFSVSFVSLGAATLLIASLLRRTVFADTAPLREDFSTLNFLNGQLHDHAVAADNSCERRCQFLT